MLTRKQMTIERLQPRLGLFEMIVEPKDDLVSHAIRQLIPRFDAKSYPH